MYILIYIYIYIYIYIGIYIHINIYMCVCIYKQAHSEMALLKAQADKEQSVFEVEWRELGKILERDRYVQNISL